MSWPLRRRQLVELEVPGVVTDPELVRRRSRPSAPDRLWVAELAVVETAAGSVYVAAVLDCHLGACRGWWTATALEPQLVARAVALAVSRHVHHGARIFGLRSDDVPLALSGRCRQAGIAVPEGSEPSPADAAVGHAFFSMLASDVIAPRRWHTRPELVAAIHEWVEAYNARLDADPLAELRWAGPGSGRS